MKSSSSSTVTRWPSSRFRPKVWIVLQRHLELTMRQCLVTVAEHFPLIQCFHCTDYGHTASTCRRDDPICVYCAGWHAFPHCPNKNDREAICCANCKFSPDGGGTPKHAANDYQVCPLAKQRQIARQKQTIYDPKHYRALMHIWARHLRFSSTRPLAEPPMPTTSGGEPQPLLPPSPLFQRPTTATSPLSADQKAMTSGQSTTVTTTIPAASKQSQTPTISAPSAFSSEQTPSSCATDSLSSPRPRWTHR